MKNNTTIIILLLFLILCNACRKFVEVENPIDQVTSDKVFRDDQTALSALAGIYISMSTTSTTPIISNGSITIYAGLSSDELFYTGTATNDKEFAGNSLSVTNSILNNNLWRQAYLLIYQANAVIEGVEQSTQLSPAVARQVVGEAMFLRSFLFFYLANLFGDAPLTISTNYQTNASMPRVPVSEIYSQIILDLKAAKELLAEDYPTAERLRVNKWAATALLARVYLYKGDWAKAEEEASEVIHSGVYDLVSDLNAVFLPNSMETLWQLYPFASSLATTEGNKFIPSTSSSTRPAYPLTDGLMASFESNDQRKSSWTKSKTVSGTLYHYPFKYKVRNIAFNTPPTEYTVMLRYAELFLIRAEARARQDNISGSIDDLNMIRQRAGITNLPGTLTPTELLEEIEKERRTELFAEWGHRWLDLKRTGRADEVLGTKPNWQGTDILFPLPHAQILLNPSLTQNAGY